MPELPSDPAMLLSVVNMHLRDSFEGSLEALCADWGITEEQLKQLMKKAGWEYNTESGRFW